MMREQREADETEYEEPQPVGSGGGVFGKPPPDNILALVPHEAVPDA